MRPFDLYSLDWRQVHRRKFEAFHLWSLRLYSSTNSLARYVFAISISKSLLIPIRLTKIDSVTLHVRARIGAPPFTQRVASQRLAHRVVHGWFGLKSVQHGCLWQSIPSPVLIESQTKFAYNGRVDLLAFLLLSEAIDASLGADCSAPRRNICGAHDCGSMKC